MRIIKRRERHERVFETNCDGCASTLEVEEADLRSRMSPRNEDVTSFTCPVCSRECYRDRDRIMWTTKEQS